MGRYRYYHIGMDREKLNDYLRQLKSETEKLESVDKDAADRLKELTGSIEEAASSLQGGDSLRTNIRGNIQQLEAEHPTVTAILDRIVNALSSMGI